MGLFVCVGGMLGSGAAAIGEIVALEVQKGCKQHNFRIWSPDL